jgi:hypothetical protein
VWAVESDQQVFTRINRRNRPSNAIIRCWKAAASAGKDTVLAALSSAGAVDSDLLMFVMDWGIGG